eukprot:70746_1
MHAFVWLTLTVHSFTSSIAGIIEDVDMRNLGSFVRFSAYYNLDDRPRKMALLIDDMQEEYRSFSLDIIGNIIDLVTTFRESDIPIFWSWWDRTPNDGISNSMDRFYGPQGIKQKKNALFIFQENGKDILHEIAPQTEIEKQRSFASDDLNMFWNFDSNGDSILDKQLKQIGIDTIIIVGAWTDECILSTALNGFSRNYDVIIASDAVDTCTPHQSSALDILSSICCKTVSTKDVIQYVKRNRFESDKTDL